MIDLEERIGIGIRSPLQIRDAGTYPAVLLYYNPRFASVAQLVEQGTENPRVVGSIPTGGTIAYSEKRKIKTAVGSGMSETAALLESEIFRRCGFSSFGRARPCQGRGGGFETRNPLHQEVASPVSKGSGSE